MPQQFKVAAVQAAPSFLDVETGIWRAVGYIEEAAKAGVKLVVFPETWLPGYPNHIWLGPVAWGMQFVGRYFENSIVAGSDHDRRLAEAARDNGIQVRWACRSARAAACTSRSGTAARTAGSSSAAAS